MAKLTIKEVNVKYEVTCECGATHVLETENELDSLDCQCGRDFVVDLALIVCGDAYIEEMK